MEMQYQVEEGILKPPLAPAEALGLGRWDPERLYLDRRHLDEVAIALNAEILRRLPLAKLSAETIVEFENIRRCIEQNAARCLGLADELQGWLKTALEKSPMFGSKRAGILGIDATMEERKGNYDRALIVLREAHEQQPSNVFFVLRQAIVLGRQAKFSAAEQLLLEVDKDGALPRF